MRALATRSAMRGSSRNSSQRPSGRSVIASRPSSSACHVSSGVFMSPGKRVADADDRDVVDVARRATSRSSSSVSSISGSPSTITVASDSMVGWRNATVAVSVTPVRSSMSLAIATASRDDRPSSTIGVESLIASADWPVALAIQLRSHSRISATVMSVRGRRRPASSRAPAGHRRRRRVANRPVRQSCSSRLAIDSASVGRSSRRVSHIEYSVSPSRRGRRWPPSRCAGCRPDRRRGRRGGRSCRWRSAGSRRRRSAARHAR